MSEPTPPTLVTPILGMRGDPPYLLMLGEDCEDCRMAGVPIWDQDCGGFLYFDAEEFCYIFECENDPEHGRQIEGRWDDEEVPFHYEKAGVVRAAVQQYQRLRGAGGEQP